MLCVVKFHTFQFPLSHWRWLLVDVLRLLFVSSEYLKLYWQNRCWMKMKSYKRKNVWIQWMKENEWIEWLISLYYFFPFFRFLLLFLVLFCSCCSYNLWDYWYLFNFYSLLSYTYFLSGWRRTALYKKLKWWNYGQSNKANEIAKSVFTCT